MLVVIRGAGDIATGIALRLYRAGIRLVLTDLPQPTSIRRTVCFSEAIRLGETVVEGVHARRADSAAEAAALTEQGIIAVLADPAAGCVQELHPDALVDAILAKKNLGTHITDAPIVIAVGPGFTAGVDCHAAVETMRGHTLGRVLYTGSPLPNTGVPGVIGGHAAERVLRAPADGLFEPCHEIGDLVEEGDTIAYVAGKPMKTTISGCLRGLLQAGVPVHEGMKSGDVDPRGKRENCDTASDKALAVGGGVLEDVLRALGLGVGLQIDVPEVFVELRQGHLDGRLHGVDQDGGSIRPGDLPGGAELVFKHELRQLLKDAVLGAENIVERARRDIGAGDDFRHFRLAVALFDEQTHAGRQDPALGIFAVVSSCHGRLPSRSRGWSRLPAGSHP